MGPGQSIYRTPNLLIVKMGDANGSIPTVQPVIGRPMWGSHPAAAALNSVVWVSQASVDNGMSTLPCVILRVIGKIESYGLRKKAEPVKNCRKITKKDMKLNDAMPKMTGEWFSHGYENWADISVDPETYEVRADGVLCDCPPATELPLTKKHFVF